MPWATSRPATPSSACGTSPRTTTPAASTSAPAACSTAPAARPASAWSRCDVAALPGARSARRDRDGHVMGHALEPVVERLERHRSVTALERRADQVVGQGRVLGQERPVDVGADDPAGMDALAAVAAVVAVAVEHAAERAHALAEPGAAGVVLEPDDRHGLARTQLAVDRDVADHARRPRLGDEVDQARAADLVALVAAVVVPEHLVAAAHRQHPGAVGDGRPQPAGPADQVVLDQELVAVLAAADVVEVGLRQWVARAAPDGREVDPAPLAPRPQDGDVAAVGVDVQMLRVEVADAQVGHAASQ